MQQSAVFALHNTIPGTTPTLWTNIKINSHGYFEHRLQILYVVYFELLWNIIWVILSPMHAAVKDKAEGVWVFSWSLFAQPHAAAPQRLGAHFAPGAEARTSTQQKCPRVLCMSGRKVLSLFWWCPKKVKRFKWRMNIMLESSDKKDIFKHKKNRTCPACRAQSALSVQSLAAQHKNKQTYEMRWRQVLHRLADKRQKNGQKTDMENM